MDDYHNHNEVAHTEYLCVSLPHDILPEPVVTDILHLAAHCCNASGAVLGFRKNNRAWSVAGLGCDLVQATSLLERLYQSTSVPKDTIMTGDMLKEGRTSSELCASSALPMRFYAGLSLLSPRGDAIGSLCVLDAKRRNLSVKQKETLRILGRQAVTQAEMSHSLDCLKKDLADCEEEMSACTQMQEKLQSQFARLTALRAIDVSILSSEDLKRTLDIVLSQVLALLQVHAASILLLDGQTQMLECAAVRGFRKSSLPLPPLRVGRGLVGRAILEGDPTPHWDMAAEGEVSERAELKKQEGFSEYYAVPLIARNAIKGVLEIYHRDALPITPEWIDFLTALAGQAAIAIDNEALFQRLERSNRELTEAYDTTIEGWSRALDLRDKETDGHSRRVTDMTLRLARMLGVSEEELVHIRRGALLHDIGKMGIPDKILLKPGTLSNEEWKIMRQHPVYAYEMLSPIAFLRPALNIPYYHHEKWDGTGYPHGLKGKQIPLAARIFAVVDVWDALSSDRPYRARWSKERVRQHLLSLAGTHFDPTIVHAFLTFEDV